MSAKRPATPGYITLAAALARIQDLEIQNAALLGIIGILKAEKAGLLKQIKAASSRRNC